MLPFLDCFASNEGKEMPTTGERSRLGMPSVWGTYLVLHGVNGSCSVPSSSPLP